MIVKGIQLVRPGQTVVVDEAELETFNRPDSTDRGRRPALQPADPDPRAPSPAARPRPEGEEH